MQTSFPTAMHHMTTINACVLLASTLPQSKHHASELDKCRFFSDGISSKYTENFHTLCCL